MNSFSGRFELTRVKIVTELPVSAPEVKISSKGPSCFDYARKNNKNGAKSTFSYLEPLDFISNTKCPKEAAGSKRGVYLGGVVYICDAVHFRCGFHSIVVGSLICSERFFPVTPVFPSSQKPTPDSNSIWNLWTHRENPSGN